MPPPQTVIDLVEHFQRNEDAYRSRAYNEAQLRREFIDPLFEALGWDVSNRLGAAEAYKDVIHEDAIKVGVGTKAPDYCFRIGGTRKFFVEAKKPSINVRKDAPSAFQLRRYAWSSKLPLSLLTNFAEFAAYDCRVQPLQTDKASAARVLFFTYEQYVENWDTIVSTFSKDAVVKGFFDKFIASTKLKRGTAEVDDAFLNEIEKWRRELASNIALRNPGLSQRELNFAVQRIIDRIIFLRISEDRGIETYGQLRDLQNSDNIYQQLCAVFQRADDRYNSGLFHFLPEKDRAELPDTLTLKLRIDDDRLKGILKRLYYPDSPYEFSVLPIDILGQVYEQFLGKVIVLTAAHHATVKDKPEVKKAGGVYYTPTYIVDYIVRNTVGKLLEGKTPKQAARLRILDPACGSGSFLIGAYHYLINWHREWYLQHGAAKHVKDIYQGSGGQWHLTIGEKKRILRNNIYGVDIDSQAVEVTKLSLLLKVLEGESEQTLNTTLRLFHERALPDLGDTIKCGNSLIGDDFYQNQQMSLLDDEERYRINVFEWSTGFPEIMSGGGFDAVIGNPPYGYMIPEEEQSYFQDLYRHQD
jgi:N-6 DNA Methylase